jgi:hypothetical protein
MAKEEGISAAYRIAGLSGLSVTRVFPKTGLLKKERSADERKKNRSGKSDKEAEQPAPGEPGRVDIEV